jgi:serine/threonine-protein kinase
MHRLHVLGKIDLRDPAGREVRPVLAQPKRLALLAYLAANTGTAGCRRDRLLGVFWPELDEHRARKALNRAVHFLRQEIGGEALVSGNGDEVEVDPTRLWCDAVAFQSALNAGDRTQALDLYAGDLLPSFYVDDAPAFDEWMEQERTRLRLAAADAARVLAMDREREGSATIAITLARRAAALSDLDERAVRQLLALLDRLGDRAGALDVYERFAHRLAVEFHAEPAVETQHLIRQIRGRDRQQSSQHRDAAAVDIRPTTTRPQFTPDSERSLSDALRARGYEIDRELGHGAMATVYLARDLKHARLVAVKVLSPEIRALHHGERFLTEIRVAAQLQHPNIVPLFDSGDADGVLFYVMPFVDGESLRSRLAREGRLSVTEAVSLARVIAGALDHAHRRGVIHRDIKPANILLSDGHAHVADFGIARAIAAPGSEVITQTGIAIGSPAYMSPEQAAADPTLDGRTDVYSVGCVLYEMLAGKSPFSGSDNVALLARHITDPVPSVRAARADVPLWLDDVLRKALAKSPDDRWATAGDFAEALSSENSPARGRRFTRLVAGSAGVTASLVALWGITTLLKPSTPLDENLVVVAPFDLVGTGARHAEYREGLMDLLAASMDGAGPLRTVPASRVITLWHSRGDVETASALARATGARYAIYGHVVAGGNDSVRVTTSLLDARSGSESEFEFRDDAGRIDRISDSLTLRMLRDLGRTRSIAAVRSAPLGWTSLPALRAFLRGEQFFRSQQRDSAEALYLRAAETDSGFAMAWHRLAEVRFWGPDNHDSLMNVYRNRAAALNHGLPARDSLLIVADSLFGALWQQNFDVSWREHQSRLYSTLAAAAKRYQDDPEVWWRLGEARFYWPTGTVTPEQALEAYDRAIALDSSFAPGYGPASLILLGLDRPSDARRYVATERAHVPASAASEGMQLMYELLSPGLRPAERDRIIASAGTKALAWAGFELEAWIDSAETAVLIARAVVDRHRSTGFNDPLVPALDDTLVYLDRLLSRGHVTAVIDGYGGRLERVPEAGDFWRLSILGIIPADSMYARIERVQKAGRPGVGTLEFLLARRDTSGLRRSQRLADSIERSVQKANPPHLVRLMRYHSQRANAYLALARAVAAADSARAFDLFRQLSDPECLGCSFRMLVADRLIFARLLASRGQDREALTLLASAALGSVSHEVERNMEIGRIAARLGDRSRAIAAYRWVTRVWQRADPPAARYVKAAADEIARLEGRRGP